MSKIELDKYYTPDDLAKYCVEKTKEIIGEKNITEYLEPSAGAGVFLKYLYKPYLAYDIKPEGDNIVQADYLTLDLEYKKGRCIIGNPPYGTKNTLSVKFYKKSLELGDYIAFILPISQLNNNQQMYEFDLIYSEDLGKKIYSNTKLHCCFNIYKRNPNGLNKKPNYKLKDVEIKEYRRGKGGKTIPSDYNYDIAICGWGNVGDKVEYTGQYVKELYIKIKNAKYRQEVIDLINNTDWKKYMNSITRANSLNLWQIYKYIKEQIPEIE